MSGLRKIVLTGPESTGKTTLAKTLASHYHTSWVPEYARTYLENLGRRYVYEDLEAIAQGQLNWEQEMARTAREYLFCDTAMVVLKVWSEYRFGKSPSIVLDALSEKRYDLFVLCGTDVPWAPDPLRENPMERDVLYRIYLNELVGLELPFIEVKGPVQDRLRQVDEAIQERF